MRLSQKHREKIKEMEAKGYVWLSHMDINAQMRFRNRTRKGFKGYVKELGLTFLPAEVAEAISIGVKRKDKPKLTLTQQVYYLQDKLAERELYIKELEERLGINSDADTCKSTLANE